MAAVRKLVRALGSFAASKSTFSSSFGRAIFDPFHVSSTRHFSNVLFDNLALARKLKGKGVPSKDVEAITAAITEVLNDNIENVQSTVMQKTEMIQEAKEKVQSSQGHHFSLLQHETKKLKNETEKLKNDIEKMRGELRDETRAEVEAAFDRVFIGLIEAICMGFAAYLGGTLLRIACIGK